MLMAVLLVGGQPGGSAPASESATPQQWSVPSGAPPGVLSNVSCPTATRCFAVGRGNDGSPIASILIGHRWWPTRLGPRPGPPAVGRGYSLVDVSCGSASSCVAVGRYYDGSRWRPLVNAWAGVGWSLYRGPARVTDFSGVSCVSSTCFAIGSSSGRARVEMNAGAGWWHPTPLPRLALGATRVLHGIDCVSATFCVAVGSATPSGRLPQTLAMMWNGSAWSSAPRPRLPYSSRGALDAVSCVSPFSCFAVGVQDTRSLIERWDGTRWSVVPSVDYWDKYFSNELTGVSCGSPVGCVAVGSAEADGIPFPGRHVDVLIETWNGTAWSLTTPPPQGDTGVNSLAGVSCTSEHCAAVGSYESSGAPTHSLALSGTVPPRAVPVTWSVADNARLLQIAAYLHESPTAAQKSAVYALAYVLGFGSRRPTPLTLPSAGTAASYTTVWEPSELAAIDSVRAQYTLDSGGATRVAVAFLSYVLALGGH